MTNPFLEAALAWAAEDFPIFPCLPGRKEPATPNGCKDATTDPEIIRKWWADNAAYNPACAPRDHTIVDVDPPLGQETWDALCERHEAAPLTFTCSTPRGGTHLWFEGATRNSSNHLGPKIDTRSYGGYVLIPPSVIAPGQYTNNPNGGSYNVTHSETIAACPRFVTESLAAKADKQKSVEHLTLDLPANIARAIQLLEDLEPITEGVGADTHTLQAAYWLRDCGLSPERTTDLLLAHLKITPRDDRFEAFIERKVSNAYTYAQNETGAYAVEDPAVAFAHITPEYTRADGSAEPGERVRLVTLNPRFKPLSLNEQITQPEPTWLIPNLIQARSLVVIYGKKKSFKSFLTLDILLGLASGCATFGHISATNAPMIYAIGEGAANMMRRHVPAWRLARDKPDDFPFYVIPAVPRAFQPDDARDIVAHLRTMSIKPAIVVVDTMARSMGGLDENNARDVGLFIAACDFLREEIGCTVIVVHHASDKPGKAGPRGSSNLSAAADTVLEVIRHEKTLAVSVWVRDQRSAQEREEPYTFQGKPIAGSLVFFPTDAAAHRAIVDAGDPIARDLVYATLQGLHAESEEDAVTVDVLASTLCSASPDDVKPIVQKLKKAAKPGGPLEAYQKNGAWFISCA